MRGSGNCKRYALDSDANIITACGIDLSILIAHYHEFQDCITKV